MLSSLLSWEDTEIRAALVHQAPYTWKPLHFPLVISNVLGLSLSPRRDIDKQPTDPVL